MAVQPRQQLSADVANRSSAGSLNNSGSHSSVTMRRLPSAMVAVQNMLGLDDFELDSILDADEPDSL